MLRLGYTQAQVVQLFYHLHFTLKILYVRFLFLLVHLTPVLVEIFFFKSYFLFMVAVTRPKFSLDYIYFVVNKLKILRFCLLCFY